MSSWLTLMIIVLVGVALFADLRRNDTEPLTEELPKTTPDLLLRPNVRDVLENGHRGTVPRPLSVRRAGQDVRKHR
ncbi:MAG: hypothetical protein L0206_09185 [Actinobacteria bacterium]|nr:hypothetical protein [Actinomycetota bacterium]